MILQTESRLASAAGRGQISLLHEMVGTFFSLVLSASLAYLARIFSVFPFSPVKKRLCRVQNRQLSNIFSWVIAAFEELVEWNWLPVREFGGGEGVREIYVAGIRERIATFFSASLRKLYIRPEE